MLRQRLSHPPHGALWGFPILDKAQEREISDVHWWAFDVQNRFGRNCIRRKALGLRFPTHPVTCTILPGIESTPPGPEMQDHPGLRGLASLVGGWGAPAGLAGAQVGIGQDLTGPDFYDRPLSGIYGFFEHTFSRTRCISSDIDRNPDNFDTFRKRSACSFQRCYCCRCPKRFKSRYALFEIVTNKNTP